MSMPTIDDSIRKIDNVICRHLDEIEDTSRGAISQDILEQLTKFVNHIMLKFYANGRDIDINEENIAKATEFAQVNSDLHTLYKFRNYLNVVTTQYTLDEDGSERLMLKYYQYLLEIDPSKKPKVSTLSAKTGLSEFTIRSGLKYMSIPERIRDISKEYPKVISYTVLVRMEPLMRAHEDYYDFKGLSEDKNEYVVNSLLSTVHIILNAKLTTQEHYAKLIKGKIDSLNNSISFDQDAFFELERETSEEIVRKTGSQLLKTSVSTLRVALATRGGGDLSSDDERLLTDLVQYIEEKELRPEEPQSQELF